jgi:outer membrane protein assembly factor BamB/3',5'-cyclic AMP phosphodiesterase CpdA
MKVVPKETPPSLIFLEGSVLDARSGEPLVGVCVSNGELIVATDRAGSFAIEAQPGIHRFLTVTTPSGYSCAEGWFRRITVDSERFDFALDPITESVPLIAAHITDLHARASDDLEKGFNTTSMLAADLARIEQELSPSFFLATGDLTEFGLISEFEALRVVLDGLNTPLYPAFGMHDADVLAHGSSQPRIPPDGPIHDWFDDSNLGVTLSGNYEQMIGPTHYSFDRGDWHFIVFPNETYAFSEYDRIRHARWLDHDLSLQPDGKPIAVSTHMAPELDFLHRLEQHNVRLILHGHSHTVRAFRWKDILIAVTTPPWAGGGDTNPRGYRSLVFDGPRCEVRFRPLSPEPRPRAPQSQPTDESRVRWETALPAHVHRAPPVSFEDSLLVSLQDEDDGAESGICRVAADGGIVWHHRTESAVRNSVALADGGLFAASQNGQLLRLDSGSGEVVWSRDLWGFPQRWVATSPLVAEGAVFVGAKAGYCAFDAGTGELRWERRLSSTRDLMADPVGDKFGAYQSLLAFDDLVVALVPRRSVMALDTNTGRIVWEEPIPGSQDTWAAPILHSEHIISGSTPGHLVALRPGSGEVVWKAVVPFDHATALTGHGEWVFGCAGDGSAFCIDADGGEVIWQHQTGVGLQDMSPQTRNTSAAFAAPVVYEGRLVVSGVDGFLHLLDIETGRCQSQVAMGAPVTAAPTPLGDGLAVATWDGTLRLLEV